MPRVLHIVQSGDRGGVQRHVHDLALGLRGQTCGIVTGTQGWLSETAQEAHIPVWRAEHLLRSRDPRAVAAARRETAYACKELSPDVLHAHGIFALLSALPLADSLPLVYTAHGFQWHDDTHPWWLRQISLRLHQRAARKVAAFVDVSAEDNEARRLGFIRVERIPNGVAPREAGSASVHTNSFGVATRLVPGKGLMELLQVLDAEPQLRLSIAGEGPMRETLDAEAKRLGIQERVDFLGWQDDLRDFYGGVFAYVSLSHKEGLPYGVLDAISAGLPVVLSDIPGHRELVVEGRNGSLVPHDDLVAVGSALRRLFLDQSFRSAAGKASSELAQRFALSTMLERHGVLYEEVGGYAR